MSDSSHPDTPRSRPAMWFARPGVLAGLILVAIAWGAYIVVTYSNPDNLASLEETSGYEFRYEPMAYVVTFLVAMALPAIVCFFKGKVWMGLIGLLVPGVSLVGAVRSAKPGSVWALRFVGKGSEPADDRSHHVGVG